MGINLAVIIPIVLVPGESSMRSCVLIIQSVLAMDGATAPRHTVFRKSQLRMSKRPLKNYYLIPNLLCGVLPPKMPKRRRYDFSQILTGLTSPQAVRFLGGPFCWLFN